jgi:tetratricopeptide (TPR) repeat protein
MVLATAWLAGCSSAEDRAQGHFDRGVQFADEGDPIKAALEFRSALQLDQNMVPAMYELAKIEQQQGDLEGAARELASIAERDPTHLEARIDLARLLLLGNQLEQALKFADEAFALAPEDIRVLTLKGAVALRLDNRFDAIRFAEAALSQDPANVDALTIRAAERLLASDPAGALGYLDAAGEAGAGNIGFQLFRIAILESLGDKDGVEAVFLKLAETYPDNAAIRTALARWYAGAGRTDDAVRTLRDFVAQNPDDVQGALSLVTFIRSQQGSDAAKAELRTLIDRGGNVFPLELALADVLLADGDIPAAIEILQQQSEVAPDAEQRTTARIQLARVFAADGQMAKALELVDAVLGEDARNVGALAVRASIRLNNDEVENAIEDLTAALNEAPESPIILQLLAEAYERNGAIALAEEQFAKAIVAVPQDADMGLRYADFLLRYGKAEQAERVLVALRGNGVTDPRILTRLADLKLRRQDWVGAEEIATALRGAGDGPEAQSETVTADRILAAALGGQQKYDESIELLRATVSQAPGAFTPLAELIQTYVRAGKVEEAQAFLTSIIESNPTNTGARILLGSVYLVSQRVDDAETAYKAAIESDPTGVDGQRALADLYARTGRIDDAKTTIQGGLERQPGNPILNLQLALVLEQQGEFEDAIAVYEAMFEEDPRSTIIANNLASLLSEHRTDPDSLNRAFEIATRFRNSEIPHFLDTLGWIYYLRGEHAQALTLLKTAADQLPDIGAVQYHLGMAYEQLGQTELAETSFQRAVELAGTQTSPERIRAVQALERLASPLGNVN